MKFRSVLIIAGRILLGLLFVAAGMVFFTPAGTNLWFLTTEEGYFVPADSSLFVFRPTQLNPGEGDWWIYGEDGRAFYYNTGRGRGRYRLITRSEASGIDGFDPQDVSSW